MTDDNLSEVAYAIDDLLSEMLEKTKLDPLSLSAIILARLVRMNQEFECHEDFNRIMDSATLRNPPQKRVYQ